MNQHDDLSASKPRRILALVADLANPARPAFGIGDHLAALNGFVAIALEAMAGVGVRQWLLNAKHCLITCVINSQNSFP